MKALGISEGNENAKGYLMAPITEKSGGELHGDTVTCLPSLLLVFCALSFTFRLPSCFHGDTISPVAQAHDLGAIFNSPFLPRHVHALGTFWKITSQIQPGRNAKRKHQ